MERLTDDFSLEVHYTRYLDDINELHATETLAAFIGKQRNYDNSDDEFWLLTYGPQSMMITAGSVRDTTANGWVAQSGTKPVRIGGVVGGKSYPEMKVSAETMQSIWSTHAHKIMLRTA